MDAYADVRRDGQSVFIIAEAGVNHNGSINLAQEMIKVAAESGADAIKFQSFKAEKLVVENAGMAKYQKENLAQNKTQLEMLKTYELSSGDHKILLETCKKHHIEFLSSPFDMESIDLLAKMGMKRWKIPSGEITNLPYLRKIASLKQEVIISTGMAELDEVKDVIDVFTVAGLPLSKISVLHCTTQYPTPFEEVNLKAMRLIQNFFGGIRVGYSDHTLGIEISIAATALGASVIEKHFTLDKTLPGPDHKASVESKELKKLVRSVRNIEAALGQPEKRVSPSESENRRVVRKSIVASKFIKSGEKFTDFNLTTKRPGNGISPMRWDEIIGKTADRDYCKNELINA